MSQAVTIYLLIRLDLDRITRPLPHALAASDAQGRHLARGLPHLPAAGGMNNVTKYYRTARACGSSWTLRVAAVCPRS